MVNETSFKMLSWASFGTCGAVVKNLPANTGDTRGRFYSWVRKILRSRKWKPTPLFLPGKSHGQRTLVGYYPWGHKEVDMTEP